MSHRLAPGPRRRVGVRGVDVRNSVLDATRSREGRDEDVEYVGEQALAVGVVSDVVETRVRAASDEFRRATLRSVWRLFWNQIVTDLTSLNNGELDGPNLIVRHLHSTGLGNTLALFTRRMRVLMEKVFKHSELCAREPFPCPAGHGIGSVVSRRVIRRGNTRRRGRAGERGCRCGHCRERDEDGSNAEAGMDRREKFEYLLVRLHIVDGNQTLRDAFR